jgi:cobalt transporter subunit CbtA
MFRRIFAAALGAGIAVGLLVAALQHVALVPLILEAERYEKGAPAHKHAGAAPQSIREAAADAIGQMPPFIARGHAQEAGQGASGDTSPWRAVLTSVATTLTSIGFALLLTGGFAVSGRNVDAREGLLWGLGGFAAFALAPAFGLPPELPGAVAADLTARQVWWAATVAATALGLGILVFGSRAWAIPVGVALLAAPHLVGAPHPVEGAGSAPPELAAAFAARSLVVNALFWALLGLAAGALYARFGRATANEASAG